MKMEDIPQRTWANRDHEELHIDDSYTGHDPSPDAIGGFYGIAWWAVFKDEDGNVYKVRCTDGVNGGRGPFQEDLKEEEPTHSNTPDGFKLGELVRFKGFEGY